MGLSNTFVVVALRQELCREPAGSWSRALPVGLVEEERGVNGVVIGFASLAGDSPVRGGLFCLGTALKGCAGGGGGVGTL